MKNITKLETSLLQAIAINELNEYNGTPLDSNATAEDTDTMQWTLTDESFALIQLDNGSTNKNPLTKANISGVIGSCVKKGLVEVFEGDKRNMIRSENKDRIQLTDKGLEVYRTVANDLV
jgi:hypothetical protein